MSAGHIRRRGGKSSWELKFDAERDPATGKRKIQYVSFKGSKQAAQVKLARLIAAVGDATYVEPSKLTRRGARAGPGSTIGRPRRRSRPGRRSVIASCSTGRSARTSARRLVQKLSTVDVERWHADAEGPAAGAAARVASSPRTVVHAHRVLSHALDDAARHSVVPRNVAKLQPPPRVQAGEMAILDREGIDTLLTELPGHEMYAPAIVALFTGLRLGEVSGVEMAQRRPLRQGDQGSRGGRGDQGARPPGQAAEDPSRPAGHRLA